MRTTAILIIFICLSNLSFAEAEITPYKFSINEYRNNNLPEYKIPKSSMFTVARSQKNSPRITYYFSKPKEYKTFPIAIFCTGSSSAENIKSVIHVHRYFLQEFLDLGVALITLEQWGVNGNQVNVGEFMYHYTRTQRLIDHKDVIKNLFKNPPHGWNGKLIFVGVSEGGSLVTALTTEFSDITLATINWSGAGDCNWREELWAFIKNIRDEMLSTMPWHIKLRSYLPNWFPFAVDSNFPKTRLEYDDSMNKTLADPTPHKELYGMTYMYHADSLNWPKTLYAGIRSPYLVVVGDKDTFVKSSDIFVRKAKLAGVKITYLRVEGMDHFIIKNQDILNQSFKWLQKLLQR